MFASKCCTESFLVTTEIPPARATCKESPFKLSVPCKVIPCIEALLSATEAAGSTILTVAKFTIEIFPRLRYVFSTFVWLNSVPGRKSILRISVLCLSILLP